MAEDTEMTQQSRLLNQIVNADERSLGAICFMFPEFVMLQDLVYDKDLSVIYTGKYDSGIKSELAGMTKQFIVVSNTGRVDVDFTDKSIILDVLYEKWGKRPKDEIVEMISNLEDDDFWSYFKHYWVLGASKIDEVQGSLFDLYKVLGKSRHDILVEYFKLREVFPDNYIFSGLLSFLEKVMSPSKVTSQSGRYIKLLDDFRAKFGKSVRNVLFEAYKFQGSDVEDKAYRTLWMLLQFGMGGV